MCAETTSMTFTDKLCSLLGLAAKVTSRDLAGPLDIGIHMLECCICSTTLVDILTMILVPTPINGLSVASYRSAYTSRCSPGPILPSIFIVVFDRLRSNIKSNSSSLANLGKTTAATIWTTRPMAFVETRGVINWTMDCHLECCLHNRCRLWVAWTSLSMASCSAINDVDTQQRFCLPPQAASTIPTHPVSLHSTSPDWTTLSLLYPMALHLHCNTSH